MTEDDNGNLHDKKGRFAKKDKISSIDYSYKQKKGPLKTLDKKETKDFIEKHRNSSINERVCLGEVNNDAKARIKAKTGIEANRVILDADSIRHAFGNVNHNLDPDDLDDMFEIVNTTTDISLSPVKNTQGNPVIIFRKPEKNGVYICEEFRSGKKELELQTAYREKKKR